MIGTRKPNRLARIRARLGVTVPPSEPELELDPEPSEVGPQKDEADTPRRRPRLKVRW
jgi:hypothetical protein